MVADNDLSAALRPPPQMPRTKRKFVDNSFARLRKQVLQKNLMEKKVKFLQRQLEEQKKCKKLMRQQMEILQEAVRRQERLPEETPATLHGREALSEFNEKLRQLVDQRLKQVESQRRPLVDVGVQAAEQPQPRRRRGPLACLAMCSAPLLIYWLLHALWSVTELVHNGTPPC